MVDVYPQGISSSVVADTRRPLPLRVGFSLPPTDRRMLMRPLGGRPSRWGDAPYTSELEQWGGWGYDSTLAGQPGGLSASPDWQQPAAAAMWPSMISNGGDNLMFQGGAAYNNQYLNFGGNTIAARFTTQQATPAWGIRNTVTAQLALGSGIDVWANVTVSEANAVKHYIGTDDWRGRMINVMGGWAASAGSTVADSLALDWGSDTPGTWMVGSSYAGSDIQVGFASGAPSGSAALYLEGTTGFLYYTTDVNTVPQQFRFMVLASAKKSKEDLDIT